MSSDGPISVRYRRPEPMEAWQVTAENIERVARWCGGSVVDDGEGRREVMVDHPEDFGLADWAEPGQWVVKRGSEQTVVLDADAFEREYEVAAFTAQVGSQVLRWFTGAPGSYRCSRPGSHGNGPRECCARV